MDRPSTDAPSAEEAPYRILIVDDECENRELEKHILDSPRYHVTEVNDGEAALTALRDDEFDVVLLDKRMPGLNGDEVCQRIRSELGLHLLPVIMVTGSGGRDDFLASMNAGASDFICKPYNPMELIARTANFAAHKRLTDQLDSTESLLFTLARMVEARDEDTGDHCSRLAHGAAVLGETLELNADEVNALRRGGILHDLGKLGIPDSILLKNGPLDDEEWVVMRQHTVIGAQLLSELKTMRPVIPIIRYHHERWDGSGYPDGLSGENIPLLARVFQLVDIYDALAYKRPYKPALPLDTIIDIFEQEGAKGWRDPALTEVFVDMLRRHPQQFELPSQPVVDASTALFERIAGTGVLDWDKHL